MKNKYTLPKDLKSITKLNEKMSNHTTFLIGGNVSYFFEPKTVNQLNKVLSFCYKNKIKFEIIGNGSNVLFSSYDFCGAIIKIGNNFSLIPKKFVFKTNKKNFVRKLSYCKHKYVFITAGKSLAYICNLYSKLGFCGFDFGVSIPGTIGGAVIMNAGAFDSDFSQIIHSVFVFDKVNKRYLWIKKQQCLFSYRNSIFQNSNYIILGVIILLQKGNKNDIIVKVRNNISLRMKTQNVGYASAGSVFRREQFVVPAKILDDMGFKGKQVGGAMVSKIHSGYIVNTGNATSDDVLQLIKQIKNEVLKKTNIVLKLEIKLMGNNMLID